MKDEAVLLSWLIVLLRAQDDVQIRFQWAYNDGSSEPDTKTLKMEVVFPDGLQTTVSTAIESISKHIATEAQAGQSMLESGSLLLSTGSLSTSSDNVNEEPTLYIEVSFRDQSLEVRPAWMSNNMLPFTVTRHIDTLVHTVHAGLSNPNTTIQSYLHTIPYDLDNIWRWNHTLPPTYNFCMHDMVAERARRSPTKVAICSWDGDLTYAQVDQYSTQVAYTLQQQLGVRQGDIVPVCFEKSRWTVVAILAVMKAGATFAMMDPSLPLGRLQNMAVQVGAATILTSRDQHDLSVEILPSGNYFVVEADIFSAAVGPTTASGADLQPVTPSTLMYIIFTSGSTGTPKGVTVSHQTYTSSAVPRAQAVGYSETSRVLDFASYAFDVSIDSMLLTLGNGGCLCIPSDEDRLNDINGVIRRMEVNYAGITPSVARILEPDVIASLSSGLGLGGEAASSRDVTIWGRDARIIIGYGPCECTIGCTVNSSAATGRDYISIGPGNGAAIWIVRPDDHNSLVPVGAVGELLVEGPIVGQGYLNDPEKTAAAFIEDPPWLTAGHKNHAGRRGRLYKTGDLGRYDPDGSGGIVFAGRKDTQVKLRGQRVELGEIESQLKAILPTNTVVIVEVIKTLGQPTLVAFIAISQSTGNQGRPCELQSADFTAEQHGMLTSADAEIAKVLPRYMVPTTYIPVNHIPVLISGKTDRKRLREYGATVDLRQLDQKSTSQNMARELTVTEQRLRDAWASVLQLNATGIRLQDNFFALGGDSLSAMRLVPVCRAHGLDLTVAETFSNPTLFTMASIIKACTVEDEVQTRAFSLIMGETESVCLEASQVCGVTRAAVEDIYPCTPTQESLFTFSLRSAEPYIAQRVACIPQNTDLDAWKKAWEQVVAKSPILRTRLAQLQGEPGLQQVVLNTGQIQWREAADLEHYLDIDHTETMGLGQSLARYAIITPPGDMQRYMVWTVHHVLYDGWSEPLILKQVSDALQGMVDTSSAAQIRQFVGYVRDIDETAMQQYWRGELHGAVGPQFPRLPSRDHVPNPDAMRERHISLPDASPGWPFTVATLIRGAWALLASRYAGNDDVVFGETLTGRDIPLAGVEDIVGPLIATVPVRIRVSRADTVGSYLQTVQQGPLTRTPYQHMGMQNIRKVSDDSQHACEAPTGLVIQPEPEYVGGELGFTHGDVVREALHFNPYPLMLACGIQKTGGFRVCASFDSAIIEVAQMERILAQLETVCHELMGNGLSHNLNEISCVPEVELNQIWQWNKTPPLSMDDSTATPRANSAITSGSEYPPAAVPWVCDLRNPSLLSPIGSPGELCLEAGFLQGDDVVESPEWLVAGSSICSGRQGKVQRTGDIVQLRDDGTVVFIGRKENVVSLHGHAVNLADLEDLFAQYLPATARAVAVVSEILSQEEDLVVFIESPGSETECVTLISTEHYLVMEGSESAICSRISIHLAAALKRLDKFIRDSLPSYMAPTCYIPIQKMPTNGGQVDRAILSHLASDVPRTTKHILTEALQTAWAQGSTHADLTVAQKILRSAWATILRVLPDEIDVDDNFFRRGGDSVLAMKLVALLRADGHRLTVADIFQHMRLGDAAKRLKMDSYTLRPAPVQSYQRFSTLDESSVEQFCQGTVKPKLADPSWGIQDVYPVTDSQGLDIRGTVHSPRTSFQYTTLYFDEQIDAARLIRATTELIQKHDILRTVFVQHKESFLQVVLDRLDDSVVTTQHASTGDNFQTFIKQLCNKNIELPFTLGSPFLRIFHVQDNASRHHCLVLGLSHAQYDGISLPLLLRDLDTLYTNPQQALQHVPFSHYISRIHDTTLQAEATTYWRSVLRDSTLSILPGQTTQPTDRAIFHTQPVSLSHDPSTQEITPATLLTGAWALVLARRLQTADVTFGGVTMGRQVEVSLAGTETVAGPCYQLTPIRVVFQNGWTARDLLRSVQRQGAESAGHDFLGFRRIQDECTRWSKDAIGFDSLVHHQDWEDFDAMDFAGARCLVEQEDPHGDAPAPMKIVSFVREGRMHVGVVGSERDRELVDEVLGELGNAVEEIGGEGGVLRV
ncbi:nonribosomal peptide synthase SidD [Aspergillus campestris IBT 28561]|uniref:Nonribosomal peptide synthase SidD n=1 Tax=Aspergillus campestris (strain IBT 28561) TaxID=1392248 RepID=A0A2I1CT75_ASPC2|nr:nonribosomal peptide synthase SidD [Aspergillus campestris IBT 28561]PKY00819.1 nonribosomal peptide synthase SidD [Aspergillus campestris IBT 28561]